MEKITGISLLVSRYKDNDAIINLLTNDGFISLLGRGIFKYQNKKIIYTQPFIYGEYEVYKGKVGGLKLKDCKIYNRFYDLKNNIKINLAFDLISELILKAKDGITSYNKVLEELLLSLNNIKNSNNDNELLYNICEFFSYIIEELGIKILFENENYSYQYFDITNGELSNSEFDNFTIKIDEEEVIIIINSFNKVSFDYSKIDKIKFMNVIIYLSYFVNSKLDIKLNSFKLLNDIIK